MSATIPRKMWIGVRFRPRSSRALVVSLDARMAG